MFTLEASFTPWGDQPRAIEELISAFKGRERQATLLGATGTWKTFTMANVIKSLGKPTLILSHNKTLAAQLATEFKYFFPQNAVHYFVSYFDYYQPESYLPEKWVYIEKEATINKEIEMFRLSTMASLLSREDVIVVSSVSALYGLGSREFFQKNHLSLEVGKDYSFDEIKQQLILMQYKPVHTTAEQGMFDIQGEMIDIYSSTEKVVYRLLFNDTTLEVIQVKDALTFRLEGMRQHVHLRPATQYMQNLDGVDEIVNAIEAEMRERVARFEKHGFLTEAQRLQKRVIYDTKMIKETWFVNGIENYSPYFENRLTGAPPNTLFDYFPDDFLLIIDESHMSIPQLGAMPRGDLSRKQVLIDHGFRLPSAIHHRPINFEELSVLLWRRAIDHAPVHPSIQEHRKSDVKTLFVSATPAQFEIDLSSRIVQQIIRPTWLLDPITYVYPKSGSYVPLEESINDVLKKTPSLESHMSGYDQSVEHDLFAKYEDTTDNVVKNL